MWLQEHQIVQFIESPFAEVLKDNKTLRSSRKFLQMREHLVNSIHQTASP